jgi:DNA-directed RNA polymerase subunit beta'
MRRNKRPTTQPVIPSLREAQAVRISLLTPEQVAELSHGEVVDHHTLDMRTERPVPGGLLCEKIFGPAHAGLCGCGTFHSNWREKGVVCPECGVELVSPSERRKRFGHIDLAVPVVHPWYRSHIATLLGIPPRKLALLIACDCYMVVRAGKSDWKYGTIITVREYLAYRLQQPRDRSFIALTGGKLIRKLLRGIDLDALIITLCGKTPSRRVNARLLEARLLFEAETRPEAMVLQNILVLPPDLRPVLVFDGGRVAMSDLNELYARVIIRNNRLKKLYRLNSPEAVIINDRKLLQRAVDALFDNERTVRATDRSGKTVLKSLSSMIGGKEGRIRRNLLGKRVDFSGRSVIVPGPELKLHQCGLPFELAMDIFRPFVYGRLMRSSLAASLQHAQAMVNHRTPAVIDALQEELKERTVLLNRAPSLHRLSIQAFEPVLLRERAIRLHPLVCSAFNADFDGDQMGVHVPVTLEAQVEARVLMLSAANLFSPASGKLMCLPSQDMVLGIYFLTKDRGKRKGEGMLFSGKEDALIAYDQGVTDLQARIRVRIDGNLVMTTPGRIIFSEVFEGALPYAILSKTVRKKDLGELVGAFFNKRGAGETVRLLDRLKEIGFRHATLSGISLCVDDMTVPREKGEIIARVEREIREIERAFADGQMTGQERSNKVIDLWKNATDEIADRMLDSLGAPREENSCPPEEKEDLRQFNSLFMMADSGARGSKDQIRQVGAMRGLMAKPTGEIVEYPIKSNLREGLTYFEYLLACHGARKGRADGALKTANAGYFTRRLVDAAHDVVIHVNDCGSVLGLPMTALYEGGDVIIPLSERITGRVLANAIYHPSSGQKIASRGDVVDDNMAGLIKEAGVTVAEIRSPVTCDLERGICAKCYGHDLASRDYPVVGDAVGIIAAQSIGEPGTQLTLRTFHSGGSASGKSERSAVLARTMGRLRYKDLKTVKGRDGDLIVVSRGGEVFVDAGNTPTKGDRVPCGAVIYVENGESVEDGQKLATWDPYNMLIVAAEGGTAVFTDVIEGRTMRKETREDTSITQDTIFAISAGIVPSVGINGKQYPLPVGALLAVKEGDEIAPGDVIARIPRTTARSVDITGGLTRVLEILEARKAAKPALLSEIDGEVSVGPPGRKLVPIEVTGRDGTKKSYQTPVTGQINAVTGDVVSAGDVLVDGKIDIQDVVRVLGRLKCALYAIDEVQKVYRGQGVETNDKHFEIILSKMLSHVEITDPGRGDFVKGEIVPRRHFLKKGVSCGARARQIIVSLTRAALLSESWLSAASFQNTASVLAEAALGKKKDVLSGTKENIIVGNVVPIGTGHERYRNTYVLPGPSEEEEQREKAVTEFLRLFGG